jgi:hypothetical protein
VLESIMASRLRAGPVCWLQVGWITGPQALIAAVTKAHQFLVFTVPSAIQVLRLFSVTHNHSMQGPACALPGMWAVMIPHRLL